MQEALTRYFEPRGRNWQVKESLRRLVEFRTFNLLDDWSGLPPLDVAILRKVLIYFGPETKKQALANVRRYLRPDGFLFLGGAETTMHIDDAFERIPIDRASCYRLRSRSTSANQASLLLKELAVSQERPCPAFV